MALKINNKTSSIQNQKIFNAHQRKLEKNLNKLSSGKRLNSAADDAAALAISKMMTAELRALNQAQRNTMDGVSMLQTAEGAMAEMGDITGRMRELAVQASNGTLSDDQRSAINDEFNALRDELSRISDTAEFNGQKLLDGSASSGIALQVGTGSETGTDQINVELGQLDPSTLGDGSNNLDTQSLSSQSGALSALSVLDGAISDISGARGNIGAMQNRLESTIENIAIERENLMEANSRIEDTDVASEVSLLAQNQILSQSSISMLGHANGLSAQSLSLLT